MRFSSILVFLVATRAAAKSGTALRELQSLALTLEPVPIAAIASPRQKTNSVNGLAPIDAPESGESFDHFFQRITRGGQFPGMRLDAPSAVQTAFFPRIRQSSWVGLRDKERRAIQEAGADLWFDWYKEKSPARLLFPDPAVAAEFKEYLSAALHREGSAMDAEQFYTAAWESLGRAEKQAFLDAYCLDAPVFGGRTLVSYLSELYGLDEARVKATTSVRLLDAAEFKAEVGRLGWHGEIYFRSITSVDPNDPVRHVVLMNEKLMVQMSRFRYPLYRMLEYAGILIHEMTHVHQDLAGNARGLDVSVRSAESLMLIEGAAEFDAETAATAAGRTLGAKNPLPLFVAEHAMETVFTDGNAQSGNLFPYTVGLPFAAALHDAASGRDAELFEATLRVIGGAQSLPDALAALFPPR